MYLDFLILGGNTIFLPLLWAERIYSYSNILNEAIATGLKVKFQDEFYDVISNHGRTEAYWSGG